MERIKPGDMPKTVDDLVITCMDFRFPEWIRSVLKEKSGVEVYDHLSLAGSSKAVIAGRLFEDIEIAHNLHSVKNVHVVDHIDCGKFGGLAAFGGSKEKEAKAHFESLDRATEAINKKLPELVVVTYVIGLEGESLER